jgi:hypothetical protein
LVNDPSVDRGNNTTQSETAVARHGDVVVVGYNDSGEFTRRNSMTGYSYSLDGGRTFTDAGVLKPGKGGRNLGDAALAVDREGNFFFATLAVDSGLDPDGFQDKELIAVDVTGGRFDGNVYLVWTEFPPRGPSRILFSRSTDGGRTFSKALRLSTSGSGVQGAMPAVGKRGELYVAWEDRSGRSTGLIKFRRSDDGGATWEREVTAATFTRMSEQDATAACGRPSLNGHIRVSELVNADETTNDNFMPVLTVAPEGQVNVFFYDRRNDRANRRIDVYRAISTDQGESWVNERVTAEPFDIPRLRPNFDPLVKDCYMGDYNDAAVDGDGFYLTWGDNRRIIKSPRFARGRPDPDVRFRAVSLEP